MDTCYRGKGLPIELTTTTTTTIVSLEFMQLRQKFDEDKMKIAKMKRSLVSQVVLFY